MPPAWEPTQSSINPRRGARSSYQNSEQSIHHRDAEQARINAIEPAAVARERGPAILHAGAALERRFAQVAELTRDVSRGSHGQYFPKRLGRDEVVRIYTGGRNTADH